MAVCFLLSCCLLRSYAPAFGVLLSPRYLASAADQLWRYSHSRIRRQVLERRMTLTVNKVQQSPPALAHQAGRSRTQVHLPAQFFAYVVLTRATG